MRTDQYLGGVHGLTDLHPNERDIPANYGSVEEADFDAVEVCMDGDMAGVSCSPTRVG